MRRYMSFVAILSLILLVAVTSYGQHPGMVRKYVYMLDNAGVTESRLSGISLPEISGTWYHVNPEDGTNKPNGGLTEDDALANLSYAYSLCETGEGDGIILHSSGTSTANTTSYLDEPITWSKHGITVFGVSAPTGMFQRSRVADGSGIDTCESLIELTGDNTTFYNVHFYNSPDDSLGGDDVALHTAVDVSGSRNAFINCHFAVVPDKATAYKSDVILDGAQEIDFIGCTFGTDTYDAGDNAACHVLLDGECYRLNFDRCKTVAQVSTGTAFGAVKSADASSIGMSIWFSDCTFSVTQANTGVPSMTSWFIGTAPTTGALCLRGCASFGYAAWDSDGDNNRVYSDMPTSAASAGGGIATTN